MDEGGALEPEEPPVSHLAIYLFTCVGLHLDGSGALESEEPPVFQQTIYLSTCVGLLMDGGGALEPEEPPVSHLSNVFDYLPIIR